MADDTAVPVNAIIPKLQLFLPDMQYDVTLSVWNKFHSPEGPEGFHRAGLKTFFIGNRRREIGGIVRKSTRRQKRATSALI